MGGGEGGGGAEAGGSCCPKHGCAGAFVYVSVSMRVLVGVNAPESASVRGAPASARVRGCACKMCAGVSGDTGGDNNNKKQNV